ncbi:MAG: hypothetical protein WC558_10725 [Patulibacter sp.]
MPASPSKSAIRRCALAATIGAGIIVAAPTSASAAGTNACDASALQLSLLGTTAIDPIHANPAYSPCVNADGTLITLPSLLGLVSVEAVTATTRTNPNSEAVSTARVAGAKIGVSGVIGDAVAGQLLGQVNGALSGLTGTLTSTPIVGPLLNLIGLNVIGTDANALLPTLTNSLTSALPNVLSAGVIEAQARAQCVNGVGQLSGSGQVAGLNVLGTAIDPNSAANQLLTIDTAQLNVGQLLNLEAIQRGITLQATGVVALALGVPSGTQLSVYDLLNQPPGTLAAVNAAISLLTGGQTIGTILTGVTTPLQNVLDGIQLNIPPGLLNVRVTPNAQAVVGDQLTRSALSLSITVLNQPILAGTLAQARVGAGAPGCTPPTTGPGVKDPIRFSSPEAEQFLQCSKKGLDLIDVYGVDGRTFVQGVAERRYVGQDAAIYLREGKKKVGTVKVGEDGLFTARVAMPPTKIRKTNKARYYAVIDGKRTRALKFARRMETRGLTSTSETVTFRGRVVGPLQRRQQAVTIKQRVSCKSYKTVATVRPDSKGNFTAKINSPTGEGAAIFRAQTRVGFRRNASRLAPTFTLPRVVGLK